MSIGTKMAWVLLIIGIMLCASVTHAQTTGDFKKPPLPGDKSKWATHPYYVGMTREDFVKLFPSDNKPYYYKEGNEEWITFQKLLPNEDTKKAIVFYLKDGKLAGWHKLELGLEPEDLLMMAKERSRGGSGSPAPIATDDIGAKKRALRASGIRD